jgi:hypothetical protein
MSCFDLKGPEEERAGLPHWSVEWFGEHVQALIVAGAPVSLSHFSRCPEPDGAIYLFPSLMPSCDIAAGVVR